MVTSFTFTDFNFQGQTAKYAGKVRDVYTVGDQVVIIATDRISAFDVVSKQGIPYKGAVLNQIAAYQLEATQDIIPNWVRAVPDPNATIGLKAEVFRIEVIVRGYLAGSAWRAYASGKRELCGSTLPEGLRENQQLDTPLLTPTTKADAGHDEDITPEEILAQGLTTAEEWQVISDYALKLFERGSQLAAERGLILVDTKYEFGKAPDGTIIVVDEIHTPDSSRYFYAEGYEQRFAAGESQRQLSKEFVREWLMGQGYQGQEPGWPVLSDDFIEEISERYIELYEQLLGKKFIKDDTDDILKRIDTNVTKELSKNEF